MAKRKVKVVDLPPCLVLTCGRQVYAPSPQVEAMVKTIMWRVDAMRASHADLIEQLMVELELRMSVPTREEHVRAIAHHQDWIDYLDTKEK